MELTQLRYFKEAAQCGNITQAAQKLHISQPALSLAIKKLDNKEITSLPFAEEELMLSVPKGHPLAGRKSILLENEKNLELIHYTCDGAYVRKVQPFIDRMKSRHAMKIYHDYFLFRQLLENQNLVCFTTKLVRRYRNDGEDRIIIPLEDEGISAVYWLSYLRDSQKKVLPILNWQKSMPFLLKESLSKR